MKPSWYNFPYFTEMFNNDHWSKYHSFRKITFTTNIYFSRKCWRQRRFEWLCLGFQCYRKNPISWIRLSSRNVFPTMFCPRMLRTLLPNRTRRTLCKINNILIRRSVNIGNQVLTSPKKLYFKTLLFRWREFTSFQILFLIIQHNSNKKVYKL